MCNTAINIVFLSKTSMNASVLNCVNSKVEF